MGWSEYSRVRAYELASHTLARVTLPVICTDGKRNRLLPEKVEILLFLRKNLLLLNFDY